MWPDRLASARWLSRCRLEGEKNLFAENDGNRAVVLASLHFGPFEVLPYWLRAHGIAATSLRTRPSEALQSLTSYQYSLSPPADIPVFLLVEDLIPMPRFAHLRQILGPGRTLVVMLDPARGLQVDVPFEDRLFRMATGAIRLAAMANARLIPCLIAETATWKFTIHFGTPVPEYYLGKSPDMQAIGSHLLQEFSKVVTRYPEQCKMRCLRAMWPRSEEEISDKSAIVQTTNGR
jgi:lauroyl/myristoyl acyltransferase